MLLGGIRAWTARVVIVAFGLGSIAWGVYAFDVFRLEAVVNDAAHAVQSGEGYSSSQLDFLRKYLDTAAAHLRRPRTLADVAVVRLRLFENDLATGTPELRASDRAELENALAAGLGAVPGDSFLWLTGYWLQEPGIRGLDRGQKLLRMSYLTGPNEGWIAFRRNPLALAAFSSLGSELAEHALSEFVKLVSSRFFDEACDTVAASGPELRKVLLSRLAQLDESDRRSFARAWAAKDLEDIAIPGIDDRPNRSF